MSDENVSVMTAREALTAAVEHAIEASRLALQAPVLECGDHADLSVMWSSLALALSAQEGDGENVTYNDHTLFRVRRALHSVLGARPGADRLIIGCIGAMQNEGILFRERQPSPTPSQEDVATLFE